MDIWKPIPVESTHIMVMLKKETLDHLKKYLQSQGNYLTTTTFDDVICEWVNWQIKAHAKIPIEVDPTLPDDTIKMGDATLTNIKEDKP